MRIQVGERCLHVTENETLVAGSVLEYTAEFAFPPAWDGYARTAVFKTAAGLIKEVLLVNDACVIPWEALTEPQYIQIGIYGVKDANVRPTLWAERQNVFPGAEQGDPVIKPETTPWAEALEAMDADVEAAQEAAQSAHDDRVAAEIAAGLAIASGGIVQFDVENDGHAYLYYTDDTPYDFAIEDGRLILYGND